MGEDPMYADAWSTRGRARLETGDFSAATEDLSKAIEATSAAASQGAASDAQSGDLSAGVATAGNAKLSSLLVARAEAWVNLRTFDLAIADCDEAMAVCQGQGGDMALARAVRGEANLLSGRLREALTDCDQALKLEPTDAYTFAVRAQAKLLLGRKLESLEDCDRALGLCPKLEYAVKVRAQARGKKIA